MSQRIAGWIIYKGFPYHKGLHRFIERQIGKWLRANASENLNGEDSNYRIVFDQEGAGGLIGCRIEIKVGSAVWASLEVAKTAEQALSRGLQHLRHVKDPQQHPSWVRVPAKVPEAV